MNDDAQPPQNMPPTERWDKESESDRTLPPHDAAPLTSQDKPAELPAEPKSEKPTVASANTTGPPPNGGLQAWIHVLGGFMLFFNTWGLLNTFGVFQTYYESGALFTETSSNISWIGAIQSYLVFTIGFLSGPIYDRGYLRTLVVFGSFCIVFGLMMLSICKTFWEALLAQGFVLGIGAGCLFVPCVAILPQYFNTKIGLAVGLASSGSALGGVIYPIVLYRLLNEIGFGWAVRVMGFMALATLLLPIAVMRMRVKPPKVRALIDWSAFKDIQFMLFVITSLIGFISLYSFLFYLSYFAQDKQITNNGMSFYIIAIFNAGSMFGRTLPNWLSDKTGPINLIGPGSIAMGILNFCMLAVDSEGGLIVIAILAGFFSGIFIALPPVCFVSLIQDKSKMGTRMGMGFGLIGLGMLVGGPGCGGILGTNHPGNWTGLWVFGGVCAMAAGVGYSILKVVKAGPKISAKV